MTLASRVAKNTAVLLIGQVCGTLLSFFSSILLVRALGSVGYGEYAVVYAFLTLFGWLVSFGTDNIIVREAARNQDDANVIWSTGILTQTVLSAASLIIVAIIAVSVGYTTRMLLLMAIAAIDMLLFAPWRLASRVFQVELRQERALAATLVRQAVWLMALIAFSLRPVSLFVLVLVRTVTAFLELIVIWSLVRPYLRLTLCFDRKRMWSLLLAAWPLAATGLSVSVYQRIDQVFVERILNVQELGYYAVAVGLVGMMSIVPLAFMSSIYPTLCQQVGSERFERILLLTFRWLLFGSIGAAGTLTLVGGRLVVWVYGEEFAPSGGLIAILAWSQVAVCFGVILSQALMAQNLQRYLAAATALGAACSVIGNLVALRWFGVIGAAWTSVMSYWVASVLVFLVFEPTRRRSLCGFVVLLKESAVGALGVIIAYIVAGDGWLGAAVFLILLALGLSVSRVITVNDLKQVRASLRGDGSAATVVNSI